jgi:hypothetical protein
MSVDGYIAGPNDEAGTPGGDGFIRLHEWYGFDGWGAAGLGSRALLPADTRQAADHTEDLSARAEECGEAKGRYFIEPIIDLDNRNGHLRAERDLEEEAEFCPTLMP